MCHANSSVLEVRAGEREEEVKNTCLLDNSENGSNVTKFFLCRFRLGHCLGQLIASNLSEILLSIKRRISDEEKEREDNVNAIAQTVMWNEVTTKCVFYCFCLFCFDSD